MTAEEFMGLFCLETTAVTANLLCVVVVIVLVVSLTSEGLVRAETVPETGAGLISAAEAELFEGLPDVSLTVAAVVVLLVVV